MQAEEDPQNLVLVLQLLHVLKIDPEEWCSKLIEEVSIITELLSHKIWMLFKDTVVIQDQIIDQIDNFSFEPHIKVGILWGVVDEAREEFETVLVVDKSAFTLEIVSLYPGSQATKDCIFQRNRAFFWELAYQVNGSALAGKLLHLTIVWHDWSK